MRGRAQIAAELRLALPEWEIELLTFGRMPLAEQARTAGDPQQTDTAASVRRTGRLAHRRVGG